MLILGNRVHDVFSVKIQEGALSVGTTATLVKSATTVLTHRKAFILYNNSALPVYLGSSTVTTSSGIPAQPGETIIVGTTEECTWYGIVSVGTADCRVIEGY